MLQFIPMIFGIIGLVGTGVDFYNAWRMDNYVSQMDKYVEFFQGQTTLYDFLGACWPSLLLIFSILILGFIIATPQRPKNHRRSW